MATYNINEDDSIEVTFTPEELNRVRHAVNLGILAMNLKSREVLKVVVLRDGMRDALNYIKEKGKAL